MWSVYYFSFLKKILNVFQKKKKWQETRADTRFCFCSSEDFKNGNKTEKSFKELSGVFFFFFLFIYTVEEREKLEMDTVEHTASTILVVQMVTKERTLSIPYWSFGCLQATWISVGAVLFFCFIFFLFPHETGGVCKCASAIRTLSGVVVFLFLFILFRCFWGRVAGITTTWTGSSNWIFVVGPETWSAVERRQKNQGWGCVLWRTECRAAEPWRGNLRGRCERTRSVPSSSPRPSKALAPCPHRLTYALLFIQAVRYNFGDGSTITTGGLLRLWQSHWKRNSQTEIRDSRSSSSPTSCT